jgi:chaperonin GroES
MQPVLKSIKPLFGRVLVQRYVAPKKSSSGMILPDSKLSSNIGTIIDVSAGKLGENGQMIKPHLQVGQTVILPEYGAIRLPKTQTHEDLVIYQEEDIIAVVEGEFNNKL